MQHEFYVFGSIILYTVVLTLKHKPCSFPTQDLCSYIQYTKSQNVHASPSLSRREFEIKLDGLSAFGIKYAPQSDMGSGHANLLF